MTRVIHAQNDVLTSFDLRAQIFRVDVEFAADYLGHTQKKNRAERLLSDIFSKKSSSVVKMDIKQYNFDH